MRYFWKLGRNLSVHWVQRKNEKKIQNKFYLIIRREIVRFFDLEAKKYFHLHI